MNALELSLLHLFNPDVEGGLGKIKGDPGGLTNLGVSTPAWKAWLRKKGRPSVPVSQATREDVVQLYEEEYWLPEHAHKLPAWAAMLVFDVGVHSGPPSGTRQLQKILGVSADGIIGPATQKALARVKPTDVIRDFTDARALSLDSIDRRKYGGRLSRGFNKRVRRLLEHSLLTYLEVSPWQVS